MQLTLLGSGTSIPLRERSSPSLSLIVNNTPVLFDIGPGTVRQLTHAGLDFEKIKHIFLTHFHPDHTADLIHFLFASRNPSVLKRRSPFVITGSSGIKEFVARLQEAYNEWLTLPSHMMKIEEVGKNTQLDYDSFRITTCATNHTPHSIAYRIESRTGTSVVVSGDTGVCDEIVELAQGADLLVLESAFPDGTTVEGHLTPSQAGEIARQAKVDQLLLTHFYPEVLETDIEIQCRKTYQGKLLLGRDLMRIDI